MQKFQLNVLCKGGGIPSDRMETARIPHAPRLPQVWSGVYETMIQWWGPQVGPGLECLNVHIRDESLAEPSQKQLT